MIEDRTQEGLQIPLQPTVLPHINKSAKRNQTSAPVEPGATTTLSPVKLPTQISPMLYFLCKHNRDQ
jgi:hypothetical protein